MKHPYKEILIAIANGEMVQWRNASGKWQDEPAVNGLLRDVANQDVEVGDYRVKPKTIRIGEFDVPEPVREPLEIGAAYWAATYTGETPYRWCDNSMDRALLANGWVHLTKEAAEDHCRALISFTKRGEA